MITDFVAEKFDDRLEGIKSFLGLEFNKKLTVKFINLLSLNFQPNLQKFKKKLSLQISKFPKSTLNLLKRADILQ